MPYTIVLHEQAYKEYIEAYEWYELRQKGLGDRFIKHTEIKLKSNKAASGILR